MLCLPRYNPSVEIAAGEPWVEIRSWFSFSRNNAKKVFESVEITSWHLTLPPLSALYLIYNTTTYFQTQNLNETISNYSEVQFFNWPDLIWGL